MGITAKKIDLSTLLCKDLKPYKDGKICTQAFNYAFQNYSEIYIPAGVYYIDNSLIVKSNTEIVADKNAGKVKPIATLVCGIAGVVAAAVALFVLVVVGSVVGLAFGSVVYPVSAYIY